MNSQLSLDHFKTLQALYGHPRAFSHIILILLSNANDVLIQRKIADAEIWIEMTSDKKISL